MRSLLHVIEGDSPAGEILPEILPALTQAGVTFRRGQFHVIAGTPGGGKTMLALWWVLKSKVPTLYFSADSDASTLAERAGAILMDKTTQEVKAMLATEACALVEDAISEGASHVRFDFDPGPSIESIEQELLAYRELHGDMPAVVVIDNLLNIHADSDNEWTAMRDNMSAVHTLARETEAAFLVLHHNSESGVKGPYPAPMAALMGKVSHLPEVVLSVALDSDREIYRVAMVKNRHGQASPTAEKYTQLAVDAARMTLYNTHSDLEMARTRRQWT